MPRSYNRVLLLCLTIIIAGCSTRTIPALNEGYAALEQKQFDQAISSADDYLLKHPTGKGTAEAYYLRGRALEQRPAANPTEVRHNLQEARRAYSVALEHNPSPALEGYIHASLSNVAYNQDDFAFSLPEAVQAFELTKSDVLQAQLLLRVGQCQLRLSRFTDADRSFMDVQQRFPSTPAANTARQLHGQRQFYVQIGTYAQSANAEAAITALRSHSVPIEKGTDSSGRTIVRMGPFGSYPEAKSAKDRFIQSFPDAVVMP